MTGVVTGIFWTPSPSGVYSLATVEPLRWFLARTREGEGEAAGGTAGERGDLAAAASRLGVRAAGPPAVALWAEGALSESLCSPASDVLSEDPLQDWRASSSRKEGRGGAKGALLGMLSVERRREKDSATGVAWRRRCDSSSLESFGPEFDREVEDCCALSERYEVGPFWGSRLRYMPDLTAAAVQGS